MEPVYTPVLWTARSLFAFQGLKFDTTGQENIPRTGGGVVALNHFGYMDFALSGRIYLDVDRIVRFMAKKEVFDNKVAGPLMRGMKHIPVDRSAGADAYRAAVDALKAGQLVGVFPEATISRSFELKEFKTGAVRMAQEAGVPVLPTVMWGAHRMWTKDHPKRLGRTKLPITLLVGPAIHVAPTDDPVERTAELKAVMKQMLDKAKADYEPLTGDDLVFLPKALGGTAPSLEEAEKLDADERARRAERKAAKAAAKENGSK